MNTDKNKEDIILLNRLISGDRSSFNTLFRKYYPVLCAYAHQFVDLEDAEEITQDVMLWLWEKREALTADIPLSNYLFKIIYNKAMNLIAKRGIMQRAKSYFYEKNKSMTEDINFYQVEELGKMIEKAVAELPESYRTAFELHRFKSMSYKEIAAALDISTKTVDYRIQQALKILRVKLKDYLPLITFLLT